MAVTVDIREFDRLRERIRPLETVELDPLLEDLGRELAFQTKKRLLSDKRSPDGGPWAPRAQPAAHPVLERSRKLASSITHQLIASGVEVGSSVVYAAPQMFGSPRQGIKARPYLGIGSEDAEALEEVAARFLGEAL